jgi:N6-L-threonylcarbamoyladenine synthase
MIILGIETSCDETSAAILEGNDSHVILKSNIIASSLSLHAKTGGVIPEVAARQQLAYILPVITEAIEKGLGVAPADIGRYMPMIDAIAVTYGPGLIGSLLVGVETARTLAFVWDKPIVPVNHMLGHIYANFIHDFSISHDNHPKRTIAPEFPAVVLVVSGGHTDLLLLEDHGKMRVLGGTRDDAAGEAFDKVGRLLGLAYPAGPIIEERGSKGNVKRFRFPRPLSDSKDYDFSFSGLKTAVLREVQGLGELDEQTVNDLAAGTQEAAVDVLVKKTMRAADEFAAKSIVLSGGVAANGVLRERFQSAIEKQNSGTSLHFPAKSLCTDNAGMIAAAAYFNYNPIGWEDVTANPELYY